MDGRRVTGGLLVCSFICVIALYIGMLVIELEFILSPAAFVLYIIAVSFFAAAMIVYFSFGRM